MTKRVEFEVPESCRAGVGAGGAPLWNSQRCRSCGAAIVWIETQAGKRMPLSLASVRQDDVTRKYMAQSHFSDCPNANAHRKGKR